MGDGEGTKSRKRKIEKQSDEGVFFLFQCLLFILLSPSPCVVIVYIIKKGVRQKVLDILCNCKLMLVIDAKVSDSKNRE